MPAQMHAYVRTPPHRTPSHRTTPKSGHQTTDGLPVSVPHMCCRMCVYGSQSPGVDAIRRGRETRREGSVGAPGSHYHITFPLPAGSATRERSDKIRSRGHVSQAKGGGLDVRCGEREGWHSVASASGGRGLDCHTTLGPNQRLMFQ